MTEEIKIILEKLKHIQEQAGIKSNFIFENSTGVLHPSTVTDFASRISKKAGIPSKSIHTLRRTLSSKLKATNLLPDAAVSSMIGNSERVNRDCYTYDLISMDEKRKIVSKAYEIK